MRQWTVDAFATEIFFGNPACVVEPLEAWPSDAWMQSLARENNQAETAFLRLTCDAERFDLRWFTPSMEVDLCGHATLASSHVLFAELGVLAETITFETRSGQLVVRRGERGYEMDFPADPPRPVVHVEGLAQALGVQPTEIWAGRYLVAILADEAAVRRAAPDMRALIGLSSPALEPGQVIVCARSDDPAFDVVDRFFAPGCGIDEDPATGSAHCILAPLYAGRLGRQRLNFRQAYPGRGGDIEAETRGERVLLRGDAVTVLQSDLRVAAVTEGARRDA